MTVYTQDIKDAVVAVQAEIAALEAAYGELEAAPSHVLIGLRENLLRFNARVDEALGLAAAQIVPLRDGLTPGAFPLTSAASILGLLALNDQAFTLVEARGYSGRILQHLATGGAS